MNHAGIPARELDDAELERQGAAAHATRNWVFLHGTAQQFQRHTDRMLELEAEYLRRHPKRTWQGAGDGPAEVDEATRLRSALRGMVTQVEALLSDGDTLQRPGQAGDEAVAALLTAVGDGEGGRLHRLELHQLARRHGIPRVALAELYKGAAPLLSAEGADRAITDAGRAWLATRSDAGT
ncbi:MAG TPA: DUF6158 family protein [Actinomycetales bacterium]|nr:DUF6158 family protein [Actinomycetales bacterium]